MSENSTQGGTVSSPTASQRPTQDTFQRFRLDAAGKHFLPHIAAGCWWEVAVGKNEVRVIQRGGPLECVVLTVEGTNMDVSDWWGWGAG